MFQLKRWKEWNQYWSIQCVPLKKGTVKKVHFPLWFLAFTFFSIGIFVASILIISFLFWSKSVGLESELVHMENYHVQNKELTVEIENMENELKEMEKQLGLVYQQIHTLDDWLKQLEGLQMEVDTLYGVLPPVLKDDLPTTTLAVKEEHTVRIASIEENSQSFSLTDLRHSLDSLYERASWQEEEYNKLKATLQTKILEARVIPSIRPAEGRLTSTFGARKDPFTRRHSEHLGIDIANHYFSPIYVTADGTVLSAERKSGYGQTIYVDHGNGYQTLYAHLAQIDVQVGDSVKQGDTIGYMGSSGRSTGVHLHYEIHKNGQPIDPLPYLN